LEADRTLGGVVSNLLVESAGNIATMDGNDAVYLMVDFRVVVYV
jgi:DNA-directed RNA polymerase subunit E'/Rpb7